MTPETVAQNNRTPFISTPFYDYTRFAGLRYLYGPKQMASEDAMQKPETTFRHTLPASSTGRRTSETIG